MRKKRNQTQACTRNQLDKTRNLFTDDFMMMPQRKHPVIPQLTRTAIRLAKSLQLQKTACLWRHLNTSLQDFEVQSDTVLLVQEVPENLFIKWK